MYEIKYESGYDLVLQYDGYSIGESYPIIYRVRKENNEDTVDNLLGYLINHTMKEKKVNCYKALLYNLLYVYKKGYDGMFVSYSSRDYSKFHIIIDTKHKTDIYLEGTKEFVATMVEKGYLEHCLGTYVGYGNYKRGYVIFTDKFKSEVSVGDDANFEVFKNIIRLKERKTKKQLEFTMTPELQELKNFMNTYNTMMEYWEVSLNGRPLDSDLYRLYLDDLMSYGRFHNTMYQSIPSEDRKDITFDGEPTVELDIRCSHPSILYAKKGYDITNQDPYDPFYIVDMSPLDLVNYNGCTLTRKDVKEFFNVLVNCATRKQALQALSTNEKLSVKYGRKHFFYDKILDIMIQRHSDIAEYFLKGLGLELMYEESEFLLQVLKECVEQEIPVLPIHDSVICSESDKLIVENIMKEAFLEKFGVECLVKTK